MTDPWPTSHWHPGPGQTWDDHPDPGEIDALGLLSGPQYAAVRRTLDDGLGTRWPDVFPSLAAELRALLDPTADPDRDEGPPVGRRAGAWHESDVGVDLTLDP